MALLLPLFVGVPHYRYQVDLDSKTYGFEFKWNARDASWYWTLLNGADAPLLAGLRVVVRKLYLWRYRLLGLPPGELEFVDTANRDAEPGLNDLGERVVLLYTPADELPQGYVA